MSGMLINLIIQIVSGAIGGNVAGGAAKSIDLGTYPIDVDNLSQPKVLGVWPGQNGVGVPHERQRNKSDIGVAKHWMFVLK